MAALTAQKAWANVKKAEQAAYGMQSADDFKIRIAELDLAIARFRKAWNKHLRHNPRRRRVSFGDGQLTQGSKE